VDGEETSQREIKIEERKGTPNGGRGEESGEKDYLKRVQVKTEDETVKDKKTTDKKYGVKKKKKTKDSSPPHSLLFLSLWGRAVCVGVMGISFSKDKSCDAEMSPTACHFHCGF